MAGGGTSSCMRVSLSFKSAGSASRPQGDLYPWPLHKNKTVTSQQFSIVLPGMDLREGVRPGYEAELCLGMILRPQPQGVRGIRGSRPPQLPVGSLQPGILTSFQCDHSEAVIGTPYRLPLLVGRDPRYHEDHRIQIEELQGPVGNGYVSLVNGIEGASQDSDAQLDPTPSIDAMRFFNSFRLCPLTDDTLISGSSFSSA